MFKKGLPSLRLRVPPTLRCANWGHGQGQSFHSLGFRFPIDQSASPSSKSSFGILISIVTRNPVLVGQCYSSARAGFVLYYMYIHERPTFLLLLKQGNYKQTTHHQPNHNHPHS